MKSYTAMFWLSLSALVGSRVLYFILHVMVKTIKRSSRLRNSARIYSMKKGALKKDVYIVQTLFCGLTFWQVASLEFWYLEKIGKNCWRTPALTMVIYKGTDINIYPSEK